MIQIRRGNTFNWRKTDRRLAEGQPGYDKVKHKLKVGDGKTGWYELPYATGLFAEEILNSEANAKARFAADSEDTTIISYGTEYPDKDTTIGKLYLQYYDAEPEVDYVVEIGTDSIWAYRKWQSGKAECWGSLEFTTAIQSAFDNKLLYHNDVDLNSVKYPFAFKEIPSENTSIQSTGNVVWLASQAANTKSSTGKYILISPYNSTAAKYNLILHVSGYWK